ncbi:unnamed protein product, partial [Meganyctiphanes norvegica]
FQSIMSKDNNQSESAKLIAAAKVGDVPGVAAALKAGADKEAGDPERHNFRPLHWSAEKGHKDAVIKLLNMGVNVDAREDRGRSALHQVCFFGHEEVAKLLIGRGVVIDAVCKETSFTPLMAASQEGYENLVLLLLNAGANIGLKEKGGKASIHYAALMGQNSVVKCLASNEADITLKDNDEWQPIHSAALNGHDMTVSTLIQLGADVNCVDKAKNTPLMAASQNGHDEVVKILLENKALADYKKSEGDTALFLASEDGHTSTAHMLITHGACVDSAKCDGSTPLIFASQNGRDELVSLYLLYGANVEAVMKNNGESSLLKACEKGHLNTVNVLIDEGADLNRKTKNDVSSLWIASNKGHVDIVELLLQNGAQKNISNKSWQATHAAADEGHLNVLVKLKEYGCDLNATTNQNNSTPLHLAITEGHTKVAEWLVVNGANLDVCDKDRNTPVQLAIKKGHSELASFMRKPPSERLQALSLDQEASGSSNKSNSSPSGDSAPSFSAGATNLDCVVCMDPRTTTVMTLPCRHAVTCQKCMNDMEERGDNRCPLCRTDISQRIPIFIN